MTSDSIIVFPPQLTWAPVAAAVTGTIDSKAARGGYGLMGFGQPYRAAYVMGGPDGGNSGYTG